MFMEVIIIFKAIDASLYTKWKSGLIPCPVKSFVKSVNARIIYLSLLLFIDTVSIALQ